MSTVVIGGGVIGLCSAWSLHRRGVDVQVLEASAVGQSASAVNAGWVTPSLSTPLASPGILATGLKHAFERDGALRIRPRLDVGWLQWLWRFQRASRPREYHAGVRALLELNHHTLDLFDELRETGVEFESHEAGLLALALEPGGLGWFRQLFDELVPMGFTGGIHYLDADEARELDPSVGEDVLAAAHTTIDRHVQPDSLLAGLTSWLRAAGVRVTEQAAVSSLERRGDAWTVTHTQGAESADHVVVALGAATNEVLRTVGMKLPILGAKGYSVTVRGFDTLPAHSLYLMEAKLGVSPFDDGVRIAGAFDLPGVDDRVDERRIGALVDQLRPYISGSRAHLYADYSTARAGLRPATPNSLPFIGEAPGRPGLYVAAGHGMLGLTLAPATGEAIADLITGRSPHAPIDAFTLEGRVA